jgi:hypothetical protein
MKKDVILKVVGLIGGVWLLSAFTSGTNKGKADYNKAVEKTLLNEGAWEAQTVNNAKDTGNWFVYNGTRTFFGTSWGVTAQFIKDFLRINPTPQYLRSINKDIAKGIYQRTCYQWIRGSEINDQWLLNLIFDWAVHAQGDLINALCDIFGYTAQERYQILNKLRFSDQLINDINKSTPSVLHEKIKQKRLAIVPRRYPSFLEGIYKRINRYNYGA